MSETTQYGGLYWCARVMVAYAQDGEIHVVADQVKVDNSGTLLFLRNDGLVNLALAPGTWWAVFAASPLDGKPVAVERWTGVVRKTS